MMTMMLAVEVSHECTSAKGESALGCARASERSCVEQHATRSVGGTYHGLGRVEDLARQAQGAGALSEGPRFVLNVHVGQYAQQPDAALLSRPVQEHQTHRVAAYLFT